MASTETLIDEQHQLTSTALELAIFRTAIGSRSVEHPPREQLLEQGLSEIDADRNIALWKLEDTVRTTYTRAFTGWVVVSIPLIIGLIPILLSGPWGIWIGRGGDCDTPLGIMLILFRVLFVFIFFRRVIILKFCHSKSARYFLRALQAACVLWPLVLFIMLRNTRTCDLTLRRSAVRSLTYYSILAVVTVIAPNVFVSIILWYIRRGLARMPRPWTEAPRGDVDQLPVLAFSPELFDDSGAPGKFKAQCSICLEAFDDKQRITQTLCHPQTHVFHTECLKEWVKCARTCPLCREDLFGCDPARAAQPAVAAAAAAAPADADPSPTSFAVV